MVDYVFSDGSGTFVKVRTDAVDTNTNRFTIMEVNDAPGGYYTLSNSLQTKFGRNLNQAVITKAELAALAVSLSYNLTATNVGVSGSAGNPVIVSSVTLAAPGSFAGATGSGAAGTLNLTWLASTNANNYVIDRATNVGFTTGVTLGVYSGPLLAFSDSGLTAATQYFYRIRAQGTNYTDSVTAATSATSHA